MTVVKQLAKHAKELYHGGNSTGSDVRATLQGITWEEATKEVYGLNTIATLVYHFGYYVTAVIEVLEGRPLSASDRFSFDCPEIVNDNNWQSLIDKTYQNADRFEALVSALPEDRIWDTFEQERYGNYFRNIQGVIEHTYYHLGQIALLIKIIRQQASDI